MFCNRTVDNFSSEQLLYAQGKTCVAGCDEAGRGPLAGPVVAGCVVLPRDCQHALYRDSKILRPGERLELEKLLYRTGAAIGIGIITEQQIDQINILQASLLAMKEAVLNLSGPPADFLLVDGKFSVPLAISQETLIKGEGKSASIAAASIIAKVTRDRLMEDLHRQYPVYNFRQNKGYPTQEHRLAIARYGPCPAHRTTFRGVREYVQ